MRRSEGTTTGTDEWLALGAAARLLGVDPDTLRRWADEGRVEVFHTPGGHRRFRRRSLQRIVAKGARERSTIASLGATPQRMTDAYRRTYQADGGAAPNPFDAVREADRETFRQKGRLLVEALVRHLDEHAAAPRKTDLDEALALSRSLGARLAASGMSLTESVALFVAARRPFMGELGVLARRRALDSRQVARLLDLASEALDRCLLSFIEGHRTATAPV
jgi:excisionase family DNA binding protein